MHVSVDTPVPSVPPRTDQLLPPANGRSRASTFLTEGAPGLAPVSTVLVIQRTVLSVIVTHNNVVKTNNESGNWDISSDPCEKIIIIVILVIGDLSVHYSLGIEFDKKYSQNWAKKGERVRIC